MCRACQGQPVTKLWLLPPPAAEAPTSAAAAAAPCDSVDGDGANSQQSNGLQEQQQQLVPLLLAEAVSPVRSRVTAAEVVQLPTAMTLATSSSSSVEESQQQQVAAVLVLGDEGGSVMIFALPASCWTPAVAAAAAGSSCSSREAWRQLHLQQQQQQQAGFGVQLQLVHRFKAAHGISHVSMVRPQPWQQHSSSSSTSRGITAAAAAAGGGSVGFSTAGRDGCIAHYSVHAVQTAAGETLQIGQQATDRLQQDLQQQQVRVVLVATERLPGVTTLEHVVHLHHTDSPVTTSHAASNVSSSSGSSSRVLLGFKSSQCVAWDESSGSALWRVECASMRRPRCFWAAADAFKLSNQGSGNSHINGSSSSGGSSGTQQQHEPQLMFAYLKDEDVHVVTYGREPAAAAAAGLGNSSAVAAAAAAHFAAAAVPVGLPSSSGQLAGGHHGREILAAVMLPGPAAAAAGCGAAGSLYALLTASEDGTVRAVVVRQKQQQQQQQQLMCAANAPASTASSRTSDNIISSSSGSVCGVTFDAGGACLEGHLLGAHSSGVAVRCLHAAAIPTAESSSVTSPSASRVFSASANSQQQQQLQPWLVVAGCAQEVLLVWQVHWQQQQQQWKLGWQLLCSKVPSRGLRPAPQAAGSASSSSDARHLAVAIVAVKRLQSAVGASPLTCKRDDDGEAAQVTATGRPAAAETGMAALIAVSLSDGRLQLLRLSLPYASWQTVAVLQQGCGCDSFLHPILSMSVLQLPVTWQKDGSTHGGDKTSSSSSSSSEAEDAYLLAAGGSDGQAYVFDVTAVVHMLHHHQQQQQQTQEQVATGSSRADSCVLKLPPLLLLPGLHQSGVNDLQLVAVTAPLLAAGSPSEAAREAHSIAASCSSDKQQQQQQQQAVTSCPASTPSEVASGADSMTGSCSSDKQEQQQQLLLVTGGDDQALAVTQLSAALSRSSSGITMALSVIGGVTCSNAHTSAIRGLFAERLQHNTHSSSSSSSSSSYRAMLLVHSVGLDQQVRSWKVTCTATDDDDERCMPDSARPAGASSGGAACGKQHCVAAQTLQLTQVDCCQTEVPEPAAICGAVVAQPGLRQQAQAVLAVCGRGLQLLQHDVEL
jgi:hypothetical protein